MSEDPPPGRRYSNAATGAPADAAVDVSVLIPVLNEQQHLPAAAAAMLAQEFDGTIEFLFIDGGSTDRSPLILAELAADDDRVRVLENPAGRTPHALNLGLRAARGEFIARMDAHALYPARYLALGVQRLRRGDVVSVSGPQIAVGLDPGSRRVALAMRTTLGTGGASFRHSGADEFDVDTGFTGVWRRSTLIAHGGWDEEFINDQDFELAARLRADGGRIVCVPAMAADYVPRDRLSTLARQYVRYGTFRVKTLQRHPGTMRSSQLLPPTVVLTAAVAVGAPRGPVRRLARVGIAAYGGALAVSAVGAARSGAGADARSLPAVWAAMHLSYGVGFLRGCARHGFPLAAISGMLSRGPG